MNKLQELLEKRDAKDAELAAIFAKYPDLDMPESVVHDIQTANKELKDLTDQIAPLHEVAASLEQSKRRTEQYNTPERTIPHQGTDDSAIGGGGGKSGGAARTEDTPSLGKMFTQNENYKEWRKSGGKPRFAFDLDVDMKTTMTTAAGFAPANNRTSKVVLSAQMPLTVGDVIPQDATDLSVIKFMEETTFTNNAAPISENDGTGLAQSALAFTQRQNLVEVIGTYLPVTLEQMEDVQGIEGLINNRLVTMVQYAEEAQFLTGSGTSPQLIGFLNKSGIQTQALGSDNIFDCLYKSLNKVRGSAGAGFANPTAFILHPLDWEPCRLAQTADGIYILGNPGDPGVDRLWGLPVVITTRITQNTGLVGDFSMFSHISRKGGLRVDVSDSHSDYFIKNLLAIRAEVRTCLEIYRAAAFCTPTGI